MKRNRLAALGLTMALTLGLAVVPASAVSFTDISGHWAKPYIEDMAARGLVKGYEDNTYRPGNTLKTSEGLAFCARALEVDADTAALVLEKHADYLDDLLGDGQSWFRTEFALCLEAGILSKPELKTLAGTGALDKELPKEALAVYLVRAMGLDLLAESQTSCPLGFVDADKISEEAKPSIYLLNMYGIVTGDEKNAFLPDSAVNRAVMATMLSRVLAFKEERGIETELPQFTDYKWMAGTVEAITVSDTGLTVLTLDNGFDQEMQAVALPADIPVYENNMKADRKTLKEGAFVRVALDGKGNAAKVDILGELSMVNGDVTALTRESALLSLGGVPKTVALNRFTMVEANGELTSLDAMDLEAGYRSAQALVDGRGVAVAIQFQGGSAKRVGLFGGKEAVANTDDLTLKVTGYDGVTQRYTMPEDVVITVNGVPGKNSAMSGYVGKFVTLRVSNDTGLITSADFDTASTYVQGSVRSIAWQTSSPTVSITDLATGKYTTYSVSDEIVVTFDGEPVEFKNVQRDWFVTGRQVAGEMVELICYPGTATASGTLMSVDYSKVPEVTFTVEDEDGLTLDFVVDINDLPTIKRDGKSSSIDKLKNGDTVVITVKYNEVTLVEATGRTANLSGTIQSISQSLDGNLMVVKLNNGEEKTYEITTSTSITKDGRAVAFNTLKAGYQISMVTDGDKVVSIEVDNATVAADSMKGTVVYVNTGDKTILFKEEGSETPISVSTSSARITSTGGDTLRLSDLEPGNTLIVYGSYTGLTFSATLIVR